MRQSPQTGKEDCLIIDFADSRRHVAGLLSAPNVFGRDPVELDKLKRYRARVEVPRIEKERLDIGTIPVVVYVDERYPFNIPDLALGDSRLLELSWNNWVYCGEGLGFYMLKTTPYSGTFRVSPILTNHGGTPTVKGSSGHGLLTYVVPGTEYVAQYTPYQSKTLFLVSSTTLEEAIRYCDARAVEWMGAEYDKVLRAAPWRWEPASDIQKALMLERLADYAALRRKDGRPSVSLSRMKEEVEEMTAGVAENVISRMDHEVPSWEVLMS